MIILTGASSYVGKNFLAASRQKNILCLVREKIPELDEKQAVVDFNSKDDLKKHINEGDIIVHIAGITDSSRKNLFSVNCGITRNLVDAAIEKKAKKFIFISSAVVGMKILGDYGESKLMAEEYLKKSGLDYIILRPSLVYGKNEKKFIGKMLWFIKNHKIVPVIGNGKYAIKTIYIGDLSEVIEKSISLKKTGIYYVTSRESIDVNERYRIMSKVLGKKFFLLHVPIIFLKIASPFARFFKKNFPSIQQLSRIAIHEDFPVDNTEKDFKIKFIGFEEGIKKTLGK